MKPRFYIATLGMSVLLLFFTASCKQKRKSGVDGYDLNSQHPLPAQSLEEQEEKPPSDADLQLHLFDDNERIVISRKDIFADPSSDFAQLKDPEFAILPDDLKGLVYFDYLDMLVAEAFNEELKNSEIDSAQLELAGASAAKIFSETSINSLKRVELDAHITIRRSIKSVIRKFETFQDFIRRILGGKNYKENYFSKAIEKKRTEGAGDSFNTMVKIQTKVDLGVGTAAKLPSGTNVRLGMLPDETLLKSLRNEGGKAHSIKLVSVIEDFELKRLEQDLRIKNSKQTPVKQDYTKGRYRLEINQKPADVNTWTQYSTPDRTMLTSTVLKSAIEDVAHAIRANQFIYVHCKSGKGRSASVVVGARVAVLIDTAKGNGKQLSKSEVDQLLTEQIAQVKSSREAIGISFAQRTNLERVLYERAILDYKPKL